MSKFKPIELKKKKKTEYELLPFRFTSLNDDAYFLSNLAGEGMMLPKKELYKLVNHKLSETSNFYIKLRDRAFLTDKNTEVAKDLLPIKLASRLSCLSEFTGLHLFVVSLRCEHSCPYCQVSRQSQDKSHYDMSEEVAEKSLDLVFKSPSKHLKIEFQGGEPLLNFELIKKIVFSSKNRATQADKFVSFVIATNLALVDDSVLSFCKEHQIDISTSLDGPKDIHNKNRPRPGGDSYERTIAGIKKAQDILGPNHVSALMTTTEASLGFIKEIIDEYIRQDLAGIFLRPLSPYGFALKSKSYSKYRVNRWLEFYKEGLNYILELNRKGVAFTEFYTQLILKKMYTFTNPGYVDLMSPAGIGIAAVVYNYDGDVYASDEGRMLAEAGDKTFAIGNVLENSYEEIFLSDQLLNPLEESFAKSAPMCEECAFEDYCGADPVFHYATQKDFVGHKPTSEFCQRNMSIFKHLVLMSENDKGTENLFRKWALRC